MFSASASNFTTVTASSSYVVAARSNVFSVQDIGLGV